MEKCTMLAYQCYCSRPQYMTRPIPLSERLPGASNLSPSDLKTLLYRRAFCLLFPRCRGFERRRFARALILRARRDEPVMTGDGRVAKSEAISLISPTINISAGPPDDEPTTPFSLRRGHRAKDDSYYSNSSMMRAEAEARLRFAR